MAMLGPGGWSIGFVQGRWTGKGDSLGLVPDDFRVLKGVKGKELGEIMRGGIVGLEGSWRVCGRVG